MGRTDRGVAMVDNPAPTRSADMPAMAAAPALPNDPPITNTCPKLPLLASGRRGRSKDAMSSGVMTFRFSEDEIASGGEPIGVTIVGPSARRLNTWAGRGAVKVTTASARAIL